jgi:hypothetical protein
MRSLLSHRVSHLAACLILVAALPGVLDASPTGPAPIAGIVKDTVGNLLEGVEVLVIDKSVSITPVATLKSDGQGRFLVSRLPRGVYRIAALKEGYLTYVGRIDTRLQQWFKVVLHPMPEISGAPLEPLPEDASWVYRLPRRYVLDSRGPEVAEAPAAADAPVEATTTREALRLQLDQLFSTAAPLGAREGTRPETSGSETRLRMASAIGDRGSIDLNGFLETFDSSIDDGEEQEAASREASAVTLAFRYDTSPDTQLDMTAFYSQRALEHTTLSSEIEGAPTPPASAEQGHRRWGYDARWTTRLDPTNKFAVEVEYQNTTFHGPGVGEPLDNPDGLSELAGSIFPHTGSMNTQAVGASGLYESVSIADHTVQVDFRAQALDTTHPVPRIDPTALTPAFFALSGLSVGVNAQDRWTVGGPFSVIYGLGYRHGISSHEASLIVPRVGGSWDIDRLSVSVLVSYHTVAGWNRGLGAEALLLSEPADAIGYEAQVELPLTAGLRLAGATSYSPVQFDYVGRAGAGFHDDPRPMYLTDGSAAVRESRVALIQESRRTRTYLEFTEGLVEGTLAAMTPYDVPQEFLTAGQLDYGTGRLGLRVLSSGTDVLLQFQQLSQSPQESTQLADSRQNSIEFRLTQDLFSIRSIGNWRFLMAIRRASLDADETDETVQQTSQVIDSMNHQVSAGLSLSF